MSIGAEEAQTGLELELLAFGNHLMWVLVAEFQCSPRATVCALSVYPSLLHLKIYVYVCGYMCKSARVPAEASKRVSRFHRARVTYRWL